VVSSTRFTTGRDDQEFTIGTMRDLLTSKPRFSSFFANIKQYRPELESLLAVKFHTLGIWEFVVFYGATWLRQDCARPAITIHFFQK
jgi:hypothetical protein